MTITHLSHFGLEKIGQSSDNVVLEGTLANCKRMAFAHGCQIASSEDFERVVGKVARYWLKGENGQHGGMIHKCQDSWCLVLPLRIWND